MNPTSGSSEPHVSTGNPAASSDTARIDGRSQTVIEASFDAVVFFEDGLVVSVNQRFEALFRGRPNVMAGQLPLLELVAPESRMAVMDLIDNGHTTIYEAVLQRFDGTRFVAEIQARTTGTQGHRSGVAIVRDINERKQAEARNRLMLELVTDLSQVASQEEVSRIIVIRAMRGMGGNLGTVGLVDPDTDRLVILQRMNLLGTIRHSFREVALDFPGPLSYTARTGAAIWIESQDEYIRRFPAVAQVIQQETNSHAIACLPLSIEGRVVGVLAISFGQPRRFEQSDRDFLMALAYQSAQALDRARLYEAERAARARAEAAAERMAQLQVVISALSQALTARQVATVSITQGVAALGALAGSVVLLAGDQLEILHSIGYPAEMLEQWRSIPLDAPVPLTACVRRNTAIWLYTRHDFMREFPTAGLSVMAESQAWAALPLVVDGHPIGALGLSFSAERTFDADERILMETLAAHCAQAIERARLYEAEAKARADAEHANELKTRFLGMISHELRTPLTSIKGFASTLLATDITFDAPTQRQYIGIIDVEANKLTALVDQLLDVSRLQAGTLPIRPETHTLSDILDIADVQMRTQAARHVLEFQISHRLPPVLADAQRIAQVIVNLVDNAAKYSPEGETIRLRARRAGDFVEVRVSDNGAGIPRKDREFVFEAFRQLERKSGARRGAGLGLAICKGLVEAHGGQIWIVNQRGRGTTIAFTLPVADSPAVLSSV